jgi:hypothetical protein
MIVALPIPPPLHICQLCHAYDGKNLPANSAHELATDGFDADVVTAVSQLRVNSEI